MSFFTTFLSTVSPLNSRCLNPCFRNTFFSNLLFPCTSHNVPIISPFSPNSAYFLFLSDFCSTSNIM